MMARLMQIFKWVSQNQSENIKMFWRQHFARNTYIQVNQDRCYKNQKLSEGVSWTEIWDSELSLSS